MTEYVGISSTWKEVKYQWIGIGGSWRTIAAKWIAIGGTWKKFYDNLAATLTGVTVSHTAISPNNAYCGIKVDTDGYLYSVRGNTYTQRYLWMLGGNSSSYECRWTTTSGDALTTGTEATWIPITSDVEFGVVETQDGSATTTNTGTLEIRRATAPNTVFASGTFTISAVVEV